MGLLDRLRDGHDEDRDWRERRGRFANCDPDTPDRPQVKPGPRPDDPARETHAYDADGGGYHDGD